MIEWESGFFVVVVGGVFVFAVTILRLVLRLGWRVYTKLTSKKDTLYG